MRVLHLHCTCIHGGAGHQLEEALHSIAVLSAALGRSSADAQGLNAKISACRHTHVAVADAAQELQIALKLEQAGALQKESEITDLKLRQSSKHHFCMHNNG